MSRPADVGPADLRIPERGVLDSAADSPAADAGGGSRQAALLLHGLPAADRAWLLDQLEPAQRHDMHGLLSELEMLGIPAAPELAQHMLISAPSDEPPSLRPPAADAAAHSTLALDAVPIARLGRLLQDEPDALVVDVLHRLERARRGRVLRIFEARRRRALVHALGQVEPPRATRLRDVAIVEAVLRRIGGSDPVASDARKGIGRFSQLLMRLRARRPAVRRGEGRA